MCFSYIILLFKFNIFTQVACTMHLASPKNIANPIYDAQKTDADGEPKRSTSRSKSVRYLIYRIMLILSLFIN